MANWDFVLPYDEESATYLAHQGLPHPAVRSVSRLPTTREMKAALEAEENLVLDYPKSDGQFYVFEQGESGFTIVIRGFDWDHDDSTPDGAFSMRWLCDLELRLLVRLSEHCGQLWLYPDTGSSPVVLDPNSDVSTILATCLEAEKRDDGWQYLHEHLYGRPA